MRKIKEFIYDMASVMMLKFIMFLDDIVDTIVTCGATVIICLLVTHFLFTPVKVNGTSMYPTLKNNDLGFSGVISRNVSGINRFDIVVIHLESRNENLVKRVIGLPNETVSMIDDVLYIDGKKVEQSFFDEEYVNNQKAMTSDGLFTKNFSYILGEDEYFCLGDNRLVSQDSRFYGPFSSKQITSTDIYIFFPFSQFGKAK